MTTNPLPDLSKWHEVPADADIPKRVRFVYLDSEGGWTTGPNYGGRLAANKASRGRYFTADQIPAPRPAPPTEPGTVLVDVTTDVGAKWDRAYLSYCWAGDGQPWLLSNLNGSDSNWAASDDLVSWTVADVVPRNTDPLNENDHRDRVDPDGDRWRRINGMWHIDKDGHPPRATLRKVVRYAGPLLFADEVL